MDHSSTTRRQPVSPEGAVWSLTAAVVALPVVVAVTMVDHRSVQWSYLAAAAGISMATGAFLLSLRRGVSSLQGVPSPGLAWAPWGLTLIILALIELGTNSPAAGATPLLIVMVTSASAVAAFRHTMVLGSVACALAALILWNDGLRSAGLVASVAVFAVAVGAALVIGTHLRRTTPDVPSRRDPALADDAAGTELMNHLRATWPVAYDEQSALEGAFSHGFPLVANIMSASTLGAIVVGEAGTPVVVSTWPALVADGTEVVDAELLAVALAIDDVIVSNDRFVIPAGWTTWGRLFLIGRTDSGLLEKYAGDEARIRRAAKTVGHEFCRITGQIASRFGQMPATPSDPLTGLDDLDVGLNRLSVEIHRSMRSETPVSVALLDVDHLAHYNLTYGQAAGDGLLRSIAAVLVSNTRDQDAIVRVGGGQFCLVLPDTDLAGAYELVEQLRAGGRDSMATFGTTVSAGITCWAGFEDPAATVERAAMALQRAKQAGRDRAVTIDVAAGF